VGRAPPPRHGTPAIRIKRHISALLAALTTLETHDIRELERDALAAWTPPPASKPPAVLEAIRALKSIGVVHVRSTGQRHQDVARVLFSSHGPVVANPGQLTELIAERADAKHQKLASVTDAAARHLFVWLFGTYPDAELAFANLPPPPPPPIPEGIDVVWLSNASERLWRLQPPGGWEVITSVLLRERLYPRRDRP
jgi:hypothetical protein